MGRMIEVLLLKPTKMASAPSGLARKNPTMLQHERANLLPVNTLGFDCSSTGAHEIPHRFMSRVRNPHRSQFTSA